MRWSVIPHPVFFFFYPALYRTKQNSGEGLRCGAAVGMWKKVMWKMASSWVATHSPGEDSYRGALLLRSTLLYCSNNVILIMCLLKTCTDTSPGSLPRWRKEEGIASHQSESASSLAYFFCGTLIFSILTFCSYGEPPK